MATTQSNGFEKRARGVAEAELGMRSCSFLIVIFTIFLVNMVNSIPLLIIHGTQHWSPERDPEIRKRMAYDLVPVPEIYEVETEFYQPNYKIRRVNTGPDYESIRVSNI